MINNVQLQSGQDEWHAEQKLKRQGNRKERVRRRGKMGKGRIKKMNGIAVGTHYERDEDKDV